MRGGFGPGVVRVDRTLPVRHYAVVDPVLDIRCRVGGTKEALVVGFVFGEQQDRTSLAMEEIVAENRVARGDGGGAVLRGVPQRWFRLLRPPGPEVAEPQGRQYMDLSLSESAIGYADFDQHVCRRGFRVLDEYVKIPVFIEYAGVEQFVLGIRLTGAPVGLYQVQIRVFILRIFIEILHVRVGRRAIQIKIVILDVLTVIGLAVGQAEHPFLEDRVLAVPQGQRKAQSLLVVADPGEAVLAPVIGARASLIVAEIVPRIPVLAVILADGAPLAFAEVGSPLPPRHTFFPRLLQPGCFGGHSLFDGWRPGHRFPPDCSTTSPSRGRRAIVFQFYRERATPPTVADRLWCGSGLVGQGQRCDTA